MVGAFLALHLYLCWRNVPLDAVLQMTYGDFKAARKPNSSVPYVVAVETEMGSKIGKLFVMVKT